MSFKDPRDFDVLWKSGIEHTGQYRSHGGGPSRILLHTLFANTSILPSKEEYKLSELRALFQIYLQFVCLERDVVFNAVLCICTNYNKDLMEYIESRRLKSKPRLTILWLKPLRPLHDVEIGLFVRRCSTLHR
jgi:hypothetical protein